MFINCDKSFKNRSKNMVVDREKNLSIFSNFL